MIVCDFIDGWIKIKQNKTEIGFFFEIGGARAKTDHLGKNRSNCFDDATGLLLKLVSLSEYISTMFFFILLGWLGIIGKLVKLQ